MNYQYLINLRAQWAERFTTDPFFTKSYCLANNPYPYIKRVGLTALTLLHLNPAQSLTDNQFRLLWAALEFASRSDISMRDELAPYSLEVATTLLCHTFMHSANDTALDNSSATSSSTLKSDSIEDYYNCMRTLHSNLEAFFTDENSLAANPSLAQILKPLNLMQRVAILKTEQKYAALANDPRAITLKQILDDYQAIYYIADHDGAMTDEEVDEYMTILERTNTFNVNIRQTATPLAIAILSGSDDKLAHAILQHDPNLLCPNEFGYSPLLSGHCIETIDQYFEHHPELFRRFTVEALCRPFKDDYYLYPSLLFQFAMPGEFFSDNTEEMLLSLLNENPNIYTEITSEALCRPAPRISNTSLLYWILQHDSGIRTLQELLRRNPNIMISGSALTNRGEDNSSALCSLLFKERGPNDSIIEERALIFEELCRRNPNLGREMSYDVLYITPERDYRRFNAFIKRFPQFYHEIGIHVLTTDFNALLNQRRPLTLKHCIDFAIFLENFLNAYPNGFAALSRKIWYNFENLVNNDIRTNPYNIPKETLIKFLRLFPKFRFLLENNTREQMLVVYQQRDYINNVVVVLSQGARQPASPLFRLPRLALNHIAMFASGHQHMNPKSALTIATATITEPRATANASSSSSSSAIAGTKRVIAAAKRTRNYQSF